jgi:CheY-like chemotaxis protein
VAILLVEDDVEIRDDIADALRGEGFEVETAGDGTEALKFLHRAAELPALILLDLMMPGMDGWDFRSHQLKDATLSAIPVVVLSGAGDLHEDIERLRAVACLQKPFKRHTLLEVIARVTSAH